MQFTFFFVLFCFFVFVCFSTLFCSLIFIIGPTSTSFEVIKGKFDLNSVFEANFPIFRQWNTTVYYESREESYVLRCIWSEKMWFDHIILLWTWKRRCELLFSVLWKMWPTCIVIVKSSPWGAVNDPLNRLFSLLTMISR